MAKIGLSEIDTTAIELYQTLKPLFIDQAISIPSGSNITMADDTWIGLGAAKGRIVFDDTLSPDQLQFEDCTLRMNGAVGIGLTPTANMDGLSIEAGLLTLKETTTPTADANYGKVYTKNDNKLYFQDGGGTEHEIAYV